MEALYLLESMMVENLYSKSRKETLEGNTSCRTDLNYKTSQGRGAQHSPICVCIPLKKKFRKVKSAYKLNHHSLRTHTSPTIILNFTYVCASFDNKVLIILS